MYVDNRSDSAGHETPRNADCNWASIKQARPALAHRIDQLITGLITLSHLDILLSEVLIKFSVARTQSLG